MGSSYSKSLVYVSRMYVSDFTVCFTTIEDAIWPMQIVNDKFACQYAADLDGHIYSRFTVPDTYPY